MNKIDTIHHICNKEDSLRIIEEGFKPSYAKEELQGNAVLIPMVSFSNILLRDNGIDEVINYGDYGIGLNREWAITNNIQPVLYSYKKGKLANAIPTLISNTNFLSYVQNYKEYWPQLKKDRTKFSDIIKLSGVSKETMEMLDYLSLNYSEELANRMSQHSKVNYDSTRPLVYLYKPYLVSNSAGKEFIAYNDREWRKAYFDKPFFLEKDATGGNLNEFKEWSKKVKPHFNEEEDRLRFKIEDIECIMVKEESEIEEFTNKLKKQFGKEIVENRVLNSELIVDTKENLINLGF